MLAVAAQFVLIRSAITVAGGNELAVGLVITFWLLFAGAGSFLASSLVNTAEKARNIFPILLLLLGILIPASAVWTPLARALFFGYDFRLDFASVAILAALSALPVAPVAGALYSTAVRALDDSSAPIRLYLFEALGALAGGIALSFFLAGTMPSIRLAFLMSFIAGGACLIVSVGANRKATAAAAALLIAAGAVVIVTPIYGWIENAVLEMRFPNQKILLSADTRFQNFTVTENKGAVYFYAGGTLAYFSQGGEREEEIAHLALLWVGENADVLIIGNGAPYLICEALKYPVNSVDVIIMDEKAHRLGLDFIPPEQRGVYSDKRVHIFYGDPFRSAALTGGKYDACIMDAGAPDCLLNSRYYTNEFIASMKAILKPGGLYAAAAPGSKNYISEPVLYINGTLYNALFICFGSVKIISGEYADYIFIASDDGAAVSAAPEFLASRAEKMNLRAKWINPAVIKSILENPRGDALQKKILESKEQKISTLLRPSALLFALESRERQSAGGVSFRFISDIGFTPVVIIPAALFLVVGSLAPMFFGRKAILSTLSAATGFSGIVMEMALLFALQAFYGYVYELAAAFTGAFMGALALGALLFLKTASKSSFRTRTIHLFGVQAVFCMFALLAVYILVNMPPNNMGALGWVILLAGTLITGAIAGYAFSLILSLYIEECRLENTIGKPGIIYGMDLIGGAAGGILSSVILIPIIGIAGAVLCVTMLSLCANLLIAVCYRRTFFRPPRTA
jgi:predicted membrane-bound spermidine synthase